MFDRIKALVGWRAMAATVAVAGGTAAFLLQPPTFGLPLATAASVAAWQDKGVFRIDWPDGAGGDLSYGGGAIGVSEDGQFLYWSCVQDDHGIAKLRIPAIGGMAQVVAPCAGPNRAEIAKVHPDPTAYRPMLGGVLEQNGRLAVSGFISYDASGATTASHWGGTSLTQLTGPVPATVAPGLVKSAMAPIPASMQALLGGTSFASAGYASIISRASYGASVSVFNIADVGTVSPIPMQMLLGCPHSIPGCQTYGNPASNDYEGSELAGGFFVIPGTRTLAVLEREGGTTCYGYATRNPAEHGQPYLDAVKCYSLSDPMDQKGPKGYPYRLVAKLYDMDELLLVKAGGKNPWDVKQYATVDLQGSTPGAFLTSGAFNPVTCEYYQVRNVGGGVNEVHVYGGICSGTPPPPAEVCGDGIDNDGDGAVDENPPCSPPPPPPSTEVCGDGVDNDGDGLVDENPPCTPPPPPALTVQVTGTVDTCRITLTAVTAPAGTGWGVQFQRKLTTATTWTSHGSRDTNGADGWTRGPFTVSAGVWDGRAVWSRTGETLPAVAAAQSYSCQ